MVHALIVSTNAQKVLDFLIQEPGKQLLANEVEKATSVSRAGVNFALRKLAQERLILREKKAKIYLYGVDYHNPIIRQLKILKTVILLQPLVDQIKEHSQKIILFGSCARGENGVDSDVDLFILTQTPQRVEERIQQSRLKERLQSVIHTPTQLAKMEKESPVFFEEIRHGITLWESTDESRI